MPTVGLTLLAIALQQGTGSAAGSTPVSGDTAGYWQQRVHYRIVATLDEQTHRVRARGSMWYVNNSPDTLRELYFHQYLNAFRPGSKWSAADEREGVDRFQYLEEPDFAYERFTAPVRVNGVAVSAEYPGAPDSTVVRIGLRTRLAPRDSLLVAFEWDARPSTIPRRQGRRGRHWDLAQWYPKIATYDRGGWQYNALRPAGEFYGEFGTYDVTLVVANDQVLGATGVPVSGDPGWSRAIRSGSARLAANAYGDLPTLPIEAPAGFRAVRFYAKDVHHFAWTASPDYRYEGGVYERRLPASRFQTWDTVSIHVLYRFGDDTTWGGQRAVRRTVAALRWLETLFGPYPYPQLTANHRIDGGGSETPMMMMNGSASLGLILHEGGHMFTYGALANNEWRSGWMDEGLTSYQTAWAQLLTPKERATVGTIDRFVRPSGYRGRGIQMQLPRFEIVSVNQTNLDLARRAQPIGLEASQFRDFEIYNEMIYDRAEVMFSQLRDLLGDTVFVGFLHDYYARWALKHVDERAMRASAERASGRDLDWFFDQWVHRTGIMDYQIRRARWSRDATGAWITQATVQRRGDYAQAMPIGVRTSTGWTFARMTAFPYDNETLRITTREQPLEVRLDPYHLTWDWDRRNDVRRARAKPGFDWPFLQQADRDRSVALWRPALWYSRPGELNAGARYATDYLGTLDRREIGLVFAVADSATGATSGPLHAFQRAQFWLRLESPYLPFTRRPAMGLFGGVAKLDDVLRIDVGQHFESLARRSAGDWSLNYLVTQGQELLPEAWIGNPSAWSVDFDTRARKVWGRLAGTHAFAQARGVAGVCDGCSYTKGEAAVGVVLSASEATRRFAARAFWGAASYRTPNYRALFLSAEDPVTTFGMNWWRPREAILKQPDIGWLPLGGAALRGYHWSVSASGIVAANAELAQRVGRVERGFGDLAFWLSMFGDAGYLQDTTLVDAGVGLRMQGRLFDQPINVRLDFPVFVSDPELSIYRRSGRVDKVAPRWVVTFNDIW